MKDQIKMRRLKKLSENPKYMFLWKYKKYRSFSYTMTEERLEKINDQYEN